MSVWCIGVSAPLSKKSYDAARHGEALRSVDRDATPTIESREVGCIKCMSDVHKMYG